MQPFIVAHRTGRRAAASQRRHRSDHPEAVPEADRAHRLRAVALLTTGATAPTARPTRRSSSTDPTARGATILLAGANFGCGSSREHAPWALADYGFRAIIAPSFADIFYGNCCQNGLLPVTLPEDAVRELFRRCEAATDGYELTVDLMTTSGARRAGLRVGVRDRALSPRDAAAGARRDRPHAAARAGDRRVRAGALGEAASPSPCCRATASGPRSPPRR